MARGVEFDLRGPPRQRRPHMRQTGAFARSGSVPDPAGPDGIHSRPYVGLLKDG